jgi:hypothetical protein
MVNFPSNKTLFPRFPNTEKSAFKDLCYLSQDENSIACPKLSPATLVYSPLTVSAFF